MAEKAATPKTEAKKDAPKGEAKKAAVTKSDEVCRAFRNTSHCRFGDDCKYTHSEGDQIEPPPRDYTPRGECHNYRDNKGECRFAERCRFQHGEEDKRATYRPERKEKDGAATGGEGEEKQVCRNFQRRGKCRFADKCRHIHVAGERKEPAPKSESKKGPKSEAKKKAPKESSKREITRTGGTDDSKGKRKRNRKSKEEKGDKIVLTEESKYDSEGLELCRNFRNKGGKCRFGDDCTFSHAPGGPIGQPAGERPPREPREPRSGGGGGAGAARVPGQCYNFRDEGKCEFGDECRFKHGEADARDFSARRTTRKAAAGICYTFQESGNCEYGKDCRFSHDTAAHA